MSSSAVESKPDDITSRMHHQRPPRQVGWKVLGILILGSALWTQTIWKKKGTLPENVVESRNDDFDWYTVSFNPQSPLVTGVVNMRVCPRY